jgi:hypothetical protein
VVRPKVAGARPLRLEEQTPRAPVRLGILQFRRSGLTAYHLHWLYSMAQDLPRSTSIATTLNQPDADVRQVALAPSPRPPKPDLPNKWQDKRKQVWSATRLRHAEENNNQDVQTPLETLAAGSLPPERSDAGPLWVELRDDEISSVESGGGNSKRPPQVSSIRLARALLRGNADLSQGANTLSLPIGLFAAGAGLMMASVV